MNNHEKQKAHKYFTNIYGNNYTNLGDLMTFGYSTMPRLVRYSSKLSPEAKLCYETLTDMILNTDETIPWMYYPSQKRIALLSGLRRQVVNKALRELKIAGLIGCKRQGLGKQNIYCLLSPPAAFFDEALQCRAILNLIKCGEISWDDISDSGEVNSSAVLAKIDAEKSMVTLDVRNNGHQEVFRENDRRVNDDTTESDNPEIHQEVFSENPSKPMPPQVAPTISEKQELTSIDVSSVELLENNINLSHSIPNQCFSEHDDIPESSQGSLSGTPDDEHYVSDEAKQIMNERRLDNLKLQYVQSIVDFFNGLKGRYPDKIRAKINRPAKITTVTKFEKGRYRTILKWFDRDIPTDYICDLLLQWIPELKTVIGGSLNYFETKAFSYISADKQSELDAYKKELFGEEEDE